MSKLELTLSEAQALYEILKHEWINPEHPGSKVVTKLMKFIYEKEEEQIHG